MWTDELPTITGQNELNVWIHLTLLSFEEQRTHQKRYSITNRKQRNKAVRVNRSGDVLQIYNHLKPEEKFFSFCEPKTKHTHIIMRWLTWVHLPIAVKRYFDYGDKYEYQEIKDNDFEGWWRQLPDFTR